MLGWITGLFQKSVDTVQANVSETPTEFSQTIVDNLRIISDTAILPVAGLILTYVFCYELYQLVVEKNRGSDFDTGQLMFLIIKTSAMILLLTNAFDITLAVFDLGKWITDHVPASTLKLPDTITDNLLNSLKDNDVGAALSMWVVAAVAVLASFVMCIIIYLVAWSRMVAILLYISIAPIPFATFLNRDWVGSIGQAYAKNLLALMLQGYFMLVCLIVYAGLLEKASGLMAGEKDGLFGLMLMLVSMAILVVSLTRTHSLAKSVVGAI
ncbi:VirB6/TrbL-like conjugal transfer protein, CD1112 family [Bacillus paramycoides]|uniref:VirB6/TrbL-like conjugal transfer protein, CD1112 family n=1 Tax=Bacillus paramycoides TaxID=2026194 RepID=UPI002E249CF7|nr:CD0415/CD1112 family protein [Bacillus paramycoides]MED0987949.1 CD0415/CD1112 family protein [Bacillus paramycoides]